MTSAATVMTPPMVAASLGVTAETVISWIRRKELAAFNVAAPGTKRARWRITPEAIQAFQAARSNCPVVKPDALSSPAKSSRKKGYKEFF